MVIIVALVVAIGFAITGGFFFTFQANLILSVVYTLLFLWGIQPENREGLPGIMGLIAANYSIVCLLILWGTFYLATGQTFVQDLFTGFNIQILR